MSPVVSRGQQRLAFAECPVSGVTGESVAFVEDFLAHAAMGSGGDTVNWPARRVDAFSTLQRELADLERQRNGE